MPRRITTPQRTPQYMAPQEFEEEATVLLAEYGHRHGHVTAPPIPIDDIIELHFELDIEIRDLRAEYPEADALGAIFFRRKCIAVDQSLVPEDYPAMLGRYRFTLAHELAHWRLHRHLYLKPSQEQALLPAESEPADHVLRAGHSDPKEVQANRLAACLLMPREMLKRAWYARQGNMEPIYLDDLRQRQHEILPHEILRRGGLVLSDENINNTLFEHACRPLAEQFEVSAEAMRIRLEGIGLLMRKKERSLFT